MLVQNALIDVQDWDVDARFAVFPQGARAKDAFFSPATAGGVLTPNKRYLFKRSKQSYPDQFWGEVIAYRIGCLLGVEVPPAFVSWNSRTGICAALIEWFYVDGDEACILAGDFLTKIQPGFDREKGKEHNLHDCSKLFRALSRSHLLAEHGWRQWWANALMFDALIGNTDRHQDNWALLFRNRPAQGGNARMPVGRISPLFDNGTSLGHERFPERVRQWDDADFRRYISRGRHHVSWSQEEPKISGHLALLSHVLAQWPETRDQVRSMVMSTEEFALRNVISDLENLECPVPLTRERFSFVCQLLQLRLRLLKELLL